jgi:hypothetical protein
MSAPNFSAVAAALLLSFLGGCAIVISGVSGGIPELAVIGVPMLLGGSAIFWIVLKRYPKDPIG